MASPGTISPGTMSSGPSSCSAFSSPSHFATTDVASELPITLVALRPMSRKVSMPMIINSPASGMPNWLKVEAITTSEAGRALGGDDQGREHRKLGAERHLDLVGLRDEDAREGAIHHRSVEVEGITE